MAAEFMKKLPFTRFAMEMRSGKIIEIDDAGVAHSDQRGMEGQQVFRTCGLAQHMVGAVGQRELPGSLRTVIVEHQQLFGSEQKEFADGLNGHFPRHGVGRGTGKEVDVRFRHVCKTVEHGAEFFRFIGLEQKVKGRMADGVKHIVGKGRVEHHAEGEIDFGTDGFEKFKSCLAWHLYIEKQHIRLYFQHGEGGFRVVAECSYFSDFRLLAEVICQLLEGVGFVVNYEYG